MPDINVKIEEPEAINIQIIESEAINVTINEMAPTLISDIFNPLEGGKRITKLFFKDGKFQGEYEID